MTEETIDPDNTIGVTYANGEIFEELAGYAADSIHRHLGIPTTVLTNVDAPDMCVSTHIFDWFDGQVMWFDADLYVIRDWDISTLPKKKINIANDGNKFLPAHFDCIDTEFDEEKYVNCGLYFAHSDYHKKIFDYAQIMYSFDPLKSELEEVYSGDGTVLNLAFQMCDADVNIIPQKYNNWELLIENDFNFEEDVVIHSAHPDNKETFLKLVKRIEEEGGIEEFDSYYELLEICYE